MRPTVPDDLAEELNEQTNKFSASVSKLKFKDRLRVLLDHLKELQVKNKELRREIEALRLERATLEREKQELQEFKQSQLVNPDPSTTDDDIGDERDRDR